MSTSRRLVGLLEGRSGAAPRGAALVGLSLMVNVVDTNTQGPSVADKRRAFRALHQQGCFVLPNPWDIGSARMLQHLGVAELADLGVRRISIGGALARVAWAAAIGAAEKIKGGSFDGLAGGAPGTRLNGMFGQFN